MAISEEQVKHVAKLAKLSFSDEERHEFTTQLGKIIDMVELLDEVDTTGVPFTSNVVETVNVMRPDRAQAGWDRDELLKNVPETEDGFIKVPAIIDNGEAGA
ncbi:Asp-tRNA(Asn)/Glu-tRNA(Gln) amidotransferase subunit GatC [Enterococcus mediterraneensis]|uniref:Asp-tRNA(Asn)/Glu-tRNA(Gln) amidotransferase subunit GatC n=1 Tax=Enterococcus mediterraneensis TaxID=2364791 RepID=UPI000F05EE40|nr:Asp-tRNA(Asn)/Glu-tRNA(Gln) amidotransferase subunit GatC [Enterococcus mediterraneensis]